MKRHPIQAISFDVGGTLIDPRPSVGHVYSQVAEEQGLGLMQHEILNRQFAVAWRSRKAFDYTRPAWAALVRETFRGLCEPEESDALFPALYARFAEARSWHVHEDVVPTLEALGRGGMPLAVTSNWDDRLHPLLEALGLARHFRVISVSGPIGLHKPDPRLFLRTCDALGCDPAGVLHVGDSQREDVAGAEAAGLRALRVDRSLTRHTAVAIPTLSMLTEYSALSPE